jgi:hypothetical protein
VSAGHATTCGVAGRISWSQPGQRYVLVAEDPVNLRTFHSPSGWDSVTVELPEAGLGSLTALRFLRPTRLTPLSARAFLWLVLSETSANFTPHKASRDQVLQLSLRGESWLAELPVQRIDDCKRNVKAHNI